MARLTECLVHIGRVDLAVRELKIIESKAPTKRMNLPSIQAQAHLAARQYNDAIADFDRAIANGGWHPLMSSMRARALEGAGRVKEALQESQRFVEGQFDAHSYRSIAKDGYRRLAYSQQIASQYLQACASFVNAAIREDNPPERVRFYIDAATAAMRGSIADPAKSEQYLYFVDDCFVKACRETGSIEWGEYDHVKMVELGAQLARAAPGRGRAVFDRLMDLIQDQPSVGAFSLTLGAGLVASEQLKAQKKDEELAAHQMRLMALESVIEALGPRGMSRS
jgi:tetratricopeptide (TPR) repeat protein